MSSYVLDQGHPDERSRLDAMASSWDPETMRLVHALGIGAGHRCLEVGAGTGSVARALAEVVGPQGYVLAVDRDIRFLDDLPEPAEVRRMDVLTDELPPAQFDLVHARLLLAHLHPHRAALHRLAAAVAPGGWLVVEEVDWTFADLIVPEAPIHATMIRTLQLLMGGPTTGFDATYGRRLLPDMLTLGLTDVAAAYRGTQSRADGRAWLAWQLLVQQFEPAIRQAGLMTEQEIAEWWALTRDDSAIIIGVAMFAAQGRRPR